MKVDRTSSDSAAAGKADLCLSKSGEQRSEGEYARTHCLYKFVRSLVDVYALCRHLVSTQFGRQNGRSKVLEQAALRDQILNIRDVVKRDGLRREQRRGKARQG